MAVVCAACAVAAAGLRNGRMWGYRVAVALLGINLVADIVNVLLGVEPRAIVGVPIVIALLVFLASGRVRAYFRSMDRAAER